VETVWILVGTAVGIGFVHTLIGIDHTLPFVVLGRARGWSLRRTLWITGLCGGGHVASSVLLGGAGIGIAILAAGLDTGQGHRWLDSRIGLFEAIESTRGELAAWALILFGLAYAAWSLARGRRRDRDAGQKQRSKARVVGADQNDAGSRRGLLARWRMAPGAASARQWTALVPSHGKLAADGAQHPPGGTAGIAGLTAWSLFVIFVLGPCEPLIPILMAPAFQVGLWAVVPVTLAFAVTTIGTMAAVVAVAYKGFGVVRLPRLQAHAHTLSGLAITSSGLAILLLAI